MWAQHERVGRSGPQHFSRHFRTQFLKAIALKKEKSYSFKTQAVCHAQYWWNLIFAIWPWIFLKTTYYKCRIIKNDSYKVYPYKPVRIGYFICLLWINQLIFSRSLQNCVCIILSCRFVIICTIVNIYDRTQVPHLLIAL